MNFETVISYFDVRQRTRNGVKAICPAHGDKEASLSISRSTRARGVIMFCHAGCKYKDILKAANIPLSVIYEDDDTPGNYQSSGAGTGSQSFWQSFRNWEEWMQKSSGETVENTYHYVNLNGGYEFSRFRMYPKDFRYGIYDNSRGYKNFMSGLNGRSRKDIPAIYTVSFSELKKAAGEGQRIFYCEGEKDVDTMHKQGYISFTCGSSKDWIPSVATICSGASEVVILADNDEAGKNLSRNVKKTLSRLNIPCRIMTPVPDTKGGDVTDYFKEHSREDFEEFLKGRETEPKVKKG